MARCIVLRRDALYSGEMEITTTVLALNDKTKLILMNVIKSLFMYCLETRVIAPMTSLFYETSTGKGLYHKFSMFC